MPTLFDPLPLRGLTLPNRMVVSPMCQYSSRDGFVGDYHLVHLGRFALGGFGTVMVEATGVRPEGRISYACPGIWSDAHIPALTRITKFLREFGAVSGIQLAHAGRKASSIPPWLVGTGQTEAGTEHWQPVAPSAEAHSSTSPMPRALDRDELPALVQSFADAAKRALAAGFDLIEIHAAHGYLLNQFLSPLANHRTDEYGGSLENRMRLPLQVIAAVRAVWPADKPLFLRISGVDGHSDGWQISDSIAFAKEAAKAGVDLIDVSATGFAQASVPPTPGMYVPFARAIKAGACVPVMAVGLIADVDQAAGYLAKGDADLIAMARASLNDPNWPMHARRHFGVETPENWNQQAGYAIERWPLRA